MDQFLKFRVFLLLSLGQRKKALELIQAIYRVQPPEAERLVQALEAESPFPPITIPDTSKLVHWMGGGLTLLGLLVSAIGIAGYFSYSDPEQEWARTTCTVEKMAAVENGGYAVTFVYTYKDQKYSISDTSPLYEELGIHEGDVLDLLVNPDQPEDARLPESKPYLQATSLRVIYVGLALLGAAVILWIFVRKRSV